MQLSPVAPPRTIHAAPAAPADPARQQMRDAIFSVTPGTFSAAQEEALTEFALEAGRDPATAASMVQAVATIAPASLIERNRAIVMGAALVAPRSSGAEVGDLMSLVMRATPAAFSPAQETAVLAVALLSGISPSDSAAIVRDVVGQTPDDMPAKARAAAMVDQLIDRGETPNARDTVARIVHSFP